MKSFLIIILSCILLPLEVLAQLYWKQDNLYKVKTLLSEQPYKSAYAKLIGKADRYLSEPHLSVVDDKDHVPASGDIHGQIQQKQMDFPI